MSMQLTGNRWALIAALGLLGSAQAKANPFFVNAKIQPDASASGWLEAPGYAGVMLLRDGIPGEWATQADGPWPGDPLRVFAPAGSDAYYLTDAGSQWPSSVAVNQVVKGIVEVETGLHGWQGPAFAGSSSSIIQKTMLTRSSLTLPDAVLNLIPAPQLLTSSASAIQLTIPSFAGSDPDVQGLALWRRPLGQGTWDWQTDLNNPSPGQALTWTDSQVLANQIYEYSVTINYLWAGGGGAGSRPDLSGTYSTLARSLSGSIMAAWLQPSPTPQPQPSPQLLPQDKEWMAYPNPLRGSQLQVVFRVPGNGPGRYRLRAYDLLGSQVGDWRGNTQKQGEQRIQQEIKQLSSGIYLLKLEWNTQDNNENHDFGIFKIAVIK